MDKNSIIAARDLVKRFGDLQAVKGISFEVEKTHCIGLLGPNGAGKTTTMRMIMGLSTVSGGRLAVFGAPVGAMTRAVKTKIGLVPQESNLDPDITVSENLEVYGRYFALPKTICRINGITAIRTGKGSVSAVGAFAPTALTDLDNN